MDIAGGRYFLTAFKILEKLLEDVLRQVPQMVRIRPYILYIIFVSREQLFLYFSASNITEFSVNLLFFYEPNILKDCLHVNAFISAIQQALQGLISKKTDEMKLGINERLIKYSLSI